MKRTPAVRRHLLAIAAVTCISCSMLSACAEPPRIGGKSVQSAFKDDPGVVQLIAAATQHNRGAAERIVASGVNVNAFGEEGVTPLLWAFGLHDRAAMEILLNLGANPDLFKPIYPGAAGLQPPSWLAARTGRCDDLQLFLEHRGNPNFVFGNETLLMTAVGWQHTDCAELLLQKGADINRTVGPMNALTQTLVQVQFADAVWVLNHGYTHDPSMARRWIVDTKPRPGQETLKAQALQMVDRLIAESGKVDRQ